MRRTAPALGLFGLMMLATAATADVTLSNFFSDNMVLQRDKPVKV